MTDPEKQTLRLTVHLSDADVATLEVLHHEHRSSASQEAELALENRMRGFRKNPRIRRKVEALLGYSVTDEDPTATEQKD